MKKVFGILVLSCMCILLGLSVRWSRAKDISLVSASEITDICLNML